MVRAILGALLLANVVAAGLVLFPPGGSAEDLDRQLASLQTQVISKQALLERTQRHAQSVELGRAEGDHFVNDYFLASRTAFSTLAGELDSAATNAKILPKDHGYSYEPIDGSDTLSVMNVTAAYEGAYPDLMRFVHEIDTVAAAADHRKLERGAATGQRQVVGDHEAGHAGARGWSGRAMSWLPANLGAERKKVIWLAGLLLTAVVAYFISSSSDSPPASASCAAHGGQIHTCAFH